MILFSGINGIGKTTIFSYIVDAFYELAKIGFLNEFQRRLGKYYRLSSNISILKSNVPSIVYLRYKINDDAVIDYVDIQGNCTEEDYEQKIPLSGKIPFQTLKNSIGHERSIKRWSIVDRDSIKAIFTATS